MTTASFTPKAILPNINVVDDIVTEHLALVSAASEIFQRASSEAVKEFVGSFRNHLGRTVTPSVLMVADTPEASKISDTILADFRNAVSFSIIAKGKAEAGMTFMPGKLIRYSDSFKIFPYMQHHAGPAIMFRTPVEDGIMFTGGNKFYGAPSPEVQTREVTLADCDRPLMQEIISRIPGTAGDNGLEGDPKLMRAMNMAFHASAMPSTFERTKFDKGRILGMWVSAFEILAHPGPGKKVNLSVVVDLLERNDWAHPKARKKFEIEYRRKPREVSIASRLYYEIYQARNSFMHGNPLPDGILSSEEGSPLFHFAPLVFRIALATYLGLEVDHYRKGEDGRLDFQKAARDLAEMKILYENAIFISLLPEIWTPKPAHFGSHCDRWLPSGPRL